MNRELKIHSVDGKKMVHSWELYHLTGLKRMNYSRWIQWNVLVVGKLGQDFFHAPENVQGRTLRFRLRYYFTIDFAMALCVLAKRREALELRQFLMSKKLSQDAE